MLRWFEKNGLEKGFGEKKCARLSESIYFLNLNFLFLGKIASHPVVAKNVAKQLKVPALHVIFYLIEKNL